MIFLKYYIEFSIIYNKKYSLYRNILINNDGSDLIKDIIWSYYKELIALDILDNFTFNNTYQCTDCFRINWKKNPSKNMLSNFYYAQGCQIEPSESIDIPCCQKLICLYSCYGTIKCKECNKIIKFCSDVVSGPSIGWNPIEGKNNLKVHCDFCNYENTINLSMNICDEECPYRFLGKLVYNKNKFYIQNNTKIILH